MRDLSLLVAIITIGFVGVCSFLSIIISLLRLAIELIDPRKRIHGPNPPKPDTK